MAGFCEHGLETLGSLLAEQLSASQEGSCFVEFVILTLCVMMKVCILEDI